MTMLDTSVNPGKAIARETRLLMAQVAAKIGEKHTYPPISSSSISTGSLRWTASGPRRMARPRPPESNARCLCMRLKEEDGRCAAPQNPWAYKIPPLAYPLLCRRRRHSLERKLLDPTALLYFCCVEVSV